jgi:hypothetical protein
MNKPGRPEVKDKRTERITLQLTKKEKEKIEKLALSSGMVTSKFCREWLLSDVDRMLKSGMSSHLMKIIVQVKDKLSF